MIKQSTYELAVQEFMAKEQAEYAARAESARAQALAQLQKQQAAQLEIREKLAVQADKMCDHDGKPLSDEAKAEWLGAHAPVMTADEISRQAEAAAAMVERPMPESCVRAMLSHLAVEQNAPAPAANPPVAAAVYRLADGRLYDVPARRWLDACEDEARIIPLGGEPTDANLKETLLHYRQTWPQIRLPAFLITESELFANLRAERDRRIAATDYLLTPDYPVAADMLAEVKAYRTALRDLPQAEGAPFDGGGEATPWPAMPAVLQ